MIQRGIGIIIGGLVTLVLLMLVVDGGVAWTQYLPPVVIGGLAAFFWPVVIGFWLGRRARRRQEARIESEVQRQLDHERRG